MLLYSSLVRMGFVFLTWPTHPNVRMKETSGFVLNQASNGVMPFKLFVGMQLMMNTAMLTTSYQISISRCMAFIILRAMPTTIRFCCSATPFYYSEWHREMARHALIHVVRREFHRGEFTTAIGPQNP